MAAHFVYALCMLPGPEPVHLSIQAKPYKTQDKWLKQVASFMMSRYVHSGFHATMKGMAPRQQKRKAISASRWSASSSISMLARTSVNRIHRELFHANIATHKRQPLLKIRDWIAMYSLILQISCKCHQAAQLQMTDT